MTRKNTFLQAEAISALTTANTDFLFAQADLIVAEPTTKIQVTKFIILDVERFPYLNGNSYCMWIDINKRLDNLRGYVGESGYIEVKFQLVYADSTVYTGIIFVPSYINDAEYNLATFLPNHIENSLQEEINYGLDGGKALHHLSNYDIGF